VSSWRLLATLFIAGALSGVLVVAVYRVTLPRVQRYAAARLDGAVREVLKAPARWDTLYLVGEQLSRTPPSGAGGADLPKAYVGFDASGKRSGVAVQAAEPGFQEELTLMIGFDPSSGAITGYTVLDQKETPGLGDKIERDTAFVAQFAGKIAPLKGARVPSADVSTVQTITGATISSRAVIRIINNAVARWTPLVQAFDRGGGQ
jgi:electron transport complex protein RnfG